VQKTGQGTLYEKGEELQLLTLKVPSGGGRGKARGREGGRSHKFDARVRVEVQAWVISEPWQYKGKFDGPRKRGGGGKRRGAGSCGRRKKRGLLDFLLRGTGGTKRYRDEGRNMKETKGGNVTISKRVEGIIRGIRTWGKQS